MARDRKRETAAGEEPEGVSAGRLRAVHVELELTVGAPRARVWKALVGEIGAWWLPGFYTTRPPRSLRLDPRPGGGMIERGAGGAGMLWYTVIESQPPSALALAGHLAPPCAGPATSLLRWTLDDDAPGGGTRVALADHVYGVVTEEVEGKLRSGWRQLLEEGLRPHVERARAGSRGPRPARRLSR